MNLSNESFEQTLVEPQAGYTGDVQSISLWSGIDASYDNDAISAKFISNLKQSPILPTSIIWQNRNLTQLREWVISIILCLIHHRY